MKILRRFGCILAAGGIFFAGTCFWLNFEYHIPYPLIPEKLVRVAAAEIFRLVYFNDMSVVETITGKYVIDALTTPVPTELKPWIDLTKNFEGLTITAPATAYYGNNPFVYEMIDTLPLVKLRERYHLDEIISGVGGEYAAMRRLIHWIGQQWDHGGDVPPGGFDDFQPVALLEDVAKGGQYWCEVSAKFVVYAATSMGWPSRLVTLSRDGYTWQHAVAEVWSNEYNKWFVVDADYNVCYEKDGVPLSAFELCHFGLEWQQQNLLKVRSIAPQKPSIITIDLLPYYAYVHIDLRNDWLSRKLQKGSPAGGDLSTWWTSRSELKNLFTVKTRIDDQERFDWPVNVTSIFPLDLRRNSKNEISLDVTLRGYSPYFSEFQWALDDGIWHTSVYSLLTVPLIPGSHQINFRLKTTKGWYGPLANFSYEWLANY